MSSGCSISRWVTRALEYPFKCMKISAPSSTFCCNLTVPSKFIFPEAAPVSKSLRLSVSPPYLKIVEFIRGRLPLHIHTADNSGWRPPVTEFYHLVHSVLGPLEHRFHAPVRQVAHPSADSEPSGQLLRVVPEEDPLDPPADPHVRPRLHHNSLNASLL